MAVQAQYPSNVLLLNRNGQEGNEYPLQAQPGGGGVGFLDQSHMLFQNGGVHPRKRGRGVGGGVATTTTTTGGGGGITAPTLIHHNNNNNNNHSFSIQSQPPPPQLIDLSQLQHHHTQPPIISTGLRLSFSDHHQPPQLQLHQYQQHQHHQHQQQNFVISHSSSAISSLLSEDLASHIKRHRDELDQFLQAQGEVLRRTLAEKRQRHYRALLGAAEESITRRLREKEAEVEKAARRNAELEARAAQLSVEAQVWQAKARAQEAAAASLHAQLQQAIVSSAAAPGKDDGGGVEGQAEDAESAYVDPDRVTVSHRCCGGGASGPGCRSCGKRAARVVVLPCRHLCLCTECDQVVQACPVCLHVRNSSVEVFLC